MKNFISPPGIHSPVNNINVTLDMPFIGWFPWSCCNQGGLVMDRSLNCGIIKSWLIAVGPFHPLPHVVTFYALSDSAKIFQGFIQAIIK